MKLRIVFLVLIGILISCQKDDDGNSEIILEGQWRLIEVLADPGDGSGIFRAVNSEKSIVFLKDGTITSNGSLCNMFVGFDSPSSGTYSVQDSTITITDCNSIGDLKMGFKLRNSAIIVSYPCFEPCLEKYVKIR